MMGGETCGHKGLLDEVDAMRAQLEVTRSTVQYKEQVRTLLLWGLWRSSSGFEG